MASCCLKTSKKNCLDFFKKNFFNVHSISMKAKTCKKTFLVYYIVRSASLVVA